MIEIRTPNAIAAIRGTVLVVELIPEPGGSAGAPRYTTKVHVLHGLVEVSDPKNPAPRPRRSARSRAGAGPAATRPALVPMSPPRPSRCSSGLHSAPQIVEGPSEFIHGVTVREQAKAVAVAEFLAPEVAGRRRGRRQQRAGRAPERRRPDHPGHRGRPGHSR